MVSVTRTFTQNCYWKSFLLLVALMICWHYILVSSTKITTRYTGAYRSSWIGNTTREIVSTLQHYDNMTLDLPRCPEIPPNIQCSNGTYGEYCNKSCGNCADPLQTCDRYSGKCLWCLPGWSGEKCDIRHHLLLNDSIPEWTLIESENPLLTAGGRYKPQECISRNRVAVIIPYRNRENHLKILLRHLHPFLQRQQLDYGIYVAEQATNGSFNKALMMNVGFKEAMQQDDYECCIFHDVDLLPEDDRNLYTCPEMPRHMSVAVDLLNYRLFYDTLFGGVTAVSTDHFRLINGYSNLFFGWGGEDDDMYERIAHNNLTLERYSEHIARYKMLRHDRIDINDKRYELLGSSRQRVKSDGLSSLQYRRIKLEKRPLFTWILVDITNTTENNTSTTENTTSTAEGITSTTEGITSTTEGITSTTETILSNSENITSIAESKTKFVESVASTTEINHTENN